MITTFITISYITALAAAADQLRRPASVWAAADRNRGWWVGSTAVLGLVACGVFISLAYLVGVVPNFANDDGIDIAFRKSR